MLIENPSEISVGRSATGTLFVVATPIGNLEDITLRALRTLKEVDLIACEDTRRTQKLLKHYAIHTQLASYHNHNEMTRAPELILRMEAGNRIALVSDAGMPVISDPGYRLVRLAIRHNIPVVPIPGASAFVATLAAAGLPLERFRFLGFLPSKRTPRQKSLREIAESSETSVFYEAPHRLAEMLEDVLKVCGDRPVAIGREVTKVHEEFLRGMVSEVLAAVKKRPLKGEITVAVGPLDTSKKTDRRRTVVESIREDMEKLMKEGKLSEREALKTLARSSGISRSQLYRYWQAGKNNRD